MKGLTFTTIELKILPSAHGDATRTNAHAAYKINAVTLIGTGWTLKRFKMDFCWMMKSSDSMLENTEMVELSPILKLITKVETVF